MTDDPGQAQWNVAEWHNKMRRRAATPGGADTDQSLCYSCGTLSSELINDRDNVGPIEIVIHRNDKNGTFTPTNQMVRRRLQRSQ